MTVEPIDLTARRPGTMYERLDAAPLLNAIRLAGVTFGSGSIMRRSVVRAKAQGWVTRATADNIAVTGLGAHPAEIYGDEW